MLKKLLDIISAASKCLGFCNNSPICFSFLSAEFLRFSISGREIENKAVSADETRADKMMNSTMQITTKLMPKNEKTESKW